MPTCRTGVIQAIRYQHSDGAMHFYTLDVVTPNWQLTQSIHTRSFTHQSTLDIITSILSDYDFNWQLSEQLLSSEPLTTQLAMRMQSDVSDYDFITGLLADIGVTTYWVSGDSVDELGYWSLVSALDENELSPLDYSYEKSSVQSGTDSVDELL
ncbi:contractile injection system protein, VgrG/Pvc8 family [Psychrobacter okhotskensis]